MTRVVSTVVDLQVVHPVRFAVVESSLGGPGYVIASLVYCGTDSYAVTVEFVGGDPWLLSREVLRDGCEGLAGGFDLSIWPAGDRVYFRFAPPEGTALAYLDASTVREFLAATERVCPFGAERVDLSDAALDSLIRGAR